MPVWMRATRHPSAALAPRCNRQGDLAINIALIIIIVIAVVLAIVGGLNQSLNFLLWVALVVGVIALIAFLFRVISGNRSS